MTQFKLLLHQNEGLIPSFWSYRLYSWLLEQMPPEVADWLHMDGEKPISQYLNHDKEKNETIWVINALSDEMAEILFPILNKTSKIPLHTGEIYLHQLQMNSIDILAGMKEPKEKSRRTELVFHTTTSFRQNGNYLIFPDVRLLLQSSIRKWNDCFPDYPIEDEDAFQMLIDGLRITKYSLHSSLFPLKNIRIPGFSGRLTVTSYLSAPLEEVWQALLLFIPFSGVGIKTSLGMGGVSRIEMPREAK